MMTSGGNTCEKKTRTVDFAQLLRRPGACGVVSLMGSMVSEEFMSSSFTWEVITAGVRLT